MVILEILDASLSFLYLHKCVFGLYWLKVVTREDFDSLQNVLRFNIQPLMVGVQSQPLVDYIKDWTVKVWETYFFREFNGLIKAIGIQKNHE
jgi:hypothetical protein